MVQLRKVLSGEMKVRSASSSPFAAAGDMPESDIHVVTSGGKHIPAHSKILASSSPVLERIIDRLQKRRSSNRKVLISGVPYDAVLVFIQFLYSSKCTKEQMERYGIHLMVLSHVYMVPNLKQRCIKALIQRLTVDNVVDVLQLARMCDAPELYLKCMKLLTKNFKAAEASDGWKFLQDHDPYLELEILQFMDEIESRRKRLKRSRREQNLYVELSEAMECLEHICTEGCSVVGPYGVDVKKRKDPCAKFSTCHGVQLLIKHFGSCAKKVSGGCTRCKRMLQLFRLHSSICEQPDECRVPLCRQFKLQAQQGRGGSDARWKLLVRKVVLAKVFSSFSAVPRKRGVELPV